MKRRVSLLLVLCMILGVLWPGVSVLAGEEDPVGENGKGVKRFARMLEKIGMTNVVCQIYPGARHELLCDLNKEQVTQDIKTWCSGILHREKSRNAGG